MNNLFAAAIVEEMIGLSSWSRAHKARTVNIVAVVVVDVAVEVMIYHSSLIDTNE